MRRIKFRVYCKGTHPTNPNFQKEGGWHLTDGILNKYYDIVAILSGDIDHEFCEHFEFQQYTGSRSSRYIEIFEGDRVRFYPTSAGSSDVQEGRVEYIERSGSFVILTEFNESYRFNQVTIL